MYFHVQKVQMYEGFRRKIRIIPISDQYLTTQAETNIFMKQFHMQNREG